MPLFHCTKGSFDVYVLTIRGFSRRIPIYIRFGDGSHFGCAVDQNVMISS